MQKIIGHEIIGLNLSFAQSLRLINSLQQMLVEYLRSTEALWSSILAAGDTSQMYEGTSKSL